MGISSDAQWTKFCKAFDVPEWDEDEKYCSNLVRGYNYFGDLREKIEDMFADYTMEEITAICDEALIPGTMCSTTKEALKEPQLHSRNMVAEIETEEMGKLHMPGKLVKFVGEPDEPIEKAPKLGEDSESVLKSLGFDKDRIAELKKENII